MFLSTAPRVNPGDAFTKKAVATPAASLNGSHWSWVTVIGFVIEETVIGFVMDDTVTGFVTEATVTGFVTDATVIGLVTDDTVTVPEHTAFTVPEQVAFTVGVPDMVAVTDPLSTIVCGMLVMLALTAGGLDTDTVPDTVTGLVMDETVTVPEHAALTEPATVTVPDMPDTATVPEHTALTVPEQVAFTLGVPDMVTDGVLVTLTPCDAGNTTFKYPFMSV